MPLPDCHDYSESHLINIRDQEGTVIRIDGYEYSAIAQPLEIVQALPVINERLRLQDPNGNRLSVWIPCHARITFT